MRASWPPPCARHLKVLLRRLGDRSGTAPRGCAGLCVTKSTCSGHRLRVAGGRCPAAILIAAGTGSRVRACQGPLLSSGSPSLSRRSARPYRTSGSQEPPLLRHPSGPRTGPSSYIHNVRALAPSSGGRPQARGLQTRMSPREISCRIYITERFVSRLRPWRPVGLGTAQDPCRRILQSPGYRISCLPQR